MKNVSVGVAEMAVQHMPQDNSCLFHAIGYLFLNQALGIAPQIREIAAECVANDVELTEAQLGKTRSSYASWIRQDSSWGGAIELFLFSRYFKTEIVSIDIQSLRLDKFGQEYGFSKRVFLLYSGAHYDALVKRRPSHAKPGASSRALDASSSSYHDEHTQTVFETTDDQSLAEAISVAQLLQSVKTGSFDSSSLDVFTLVCDACGFCFTGESEAAKHAKDSGHVAFSQTKY